MAEDRRALVGKVRVGIGGGRDGVFERVAFAGDGVRAIAGDVRKESGLAERRLLVLWGGGAAVLVRVLACVTRAGNAKEIFDALRDLAVLSIDRLVGRHGQAGEGALLCHGGMGRVGRAEELRHCERRGWAPWNSRTASLEEQRRCCEQADVGAGVWCKCRASC